MARCLPGCTCGRHGQRIGSKHVHGCKCTTCYDTRHKRVNARRGSAKNQACISCNGAAKNWAHIHDSDPEEASNYQPMCLKCHRAYDGWNLMISEAQRRRWAAIPPEERNASPEYRKKMSEAMKARWARTRKEQSVEQ